MKQKCLPPETAGCADCWLLHGTDLFETLGIYQLDLFILWNLKVHYHVQESPSFVRMLSQINPVYALPMYGFKLNTRPVYLKQCLHFVSLRT